MHLVTLSLIFITFNLIGSILSKSAIKKQFRPNNGFLNLQSINGQEKPRENNIISIESSASKRLDTDLIRLIIEVVNYDDKACKANNQNVDLTDDLIENLNKYGVPNSNITTLIYDIKPNYDLEGLFYEDAEEIGYKAKNRMQIIIGKMGNFTKIIDWINDQKFIKVISLEFGYSNNLIEQTKKELLNQAAKEANRDANSVADSLGVKIVGIDKLDINHIDIPLINHPKKLFYRSSEYNDIFRIITVLKINFKIEKKVKQ